MIQASQNDQILDTTVDKWFLSQQCYSSNAILNETHDKILTSILSIFYYPSSNDVIYPDLLKVKVDELDDAISYKFQLVCYTTN